MPIRRAIHALADSPGFTGWISRRGMDWGFARRFIAGESLAEALPAVRELNRKRLRVTLDYLGESVTDPETTRAAAAEYCEILDAVAGEGVDASISLKLSQLGQAISDDLAHENLERVLARAAELDNFVRVDMEDSSTTQQTVDTVKALRPSFANMGIAIQSYLHRSEQDIRDLNAIDCQVRLCKGAYKEPEAVAFQSKSEVDQNYKRLVEVLLDDGNYPAFATHDPEMIRHVLGEADRRNRDRLDFEFQMLYGIRRDEQTNIVEQGCSLRVYVPFGTEWCPYFMRRIAERPANAFFVLRAVVGG